MRIVGKTPHSFFVPMAASSGFRQQPQSLDLFPRWQCATRTTTLLSNDVLVIYTDGVTEANDADGNEFGEARLRKSVRENPQHPPAALLTAIQDAVQKLAVGEQFDDLTLLWRVRSSIAANLFALGERAVDNAEPLGVPRPVQASQPGPAE